MMDFAEGSERSILHHSRYTRIGIIEIPLIQVQDFPTLRKTCSRPTMRLLLSGITMHHHKLAALRHLLHGMEQELGLDQISPTQRDILYAANLLAEHTGCFTTGQLRKHPMMQQIPKPTFFRGLKALLDNNLIVADPNAPGGTYRLTQS